MKIVISGGAGTGKSSIADAVAKELKLKRYSTGDMQREFAKEKGISINELSKLEREDPKIDLEIDRRSKSLGEREDDFIIDSRLAAFFIPDSLKVYLKTDIDERVRRRMLQKRDTESFSDPVKARDAILERDEVDRERWKKLYGFDYMDEDSYDLIVDTTIISIKEAADLIVDAARSLF